MVSIAIGVYMVASFINTTGDVRRSVKEELKGLKTMDLSAMTTEELQKSRNRLNYCHHLAIFVTPRLHDRSRERIKEIDSFLNFSTLADSARELV